MFRSAWLIYVFIHTVKTWCQGFKDEQGSIPVGCVPPAFSVLMGGGVCPAQPLASQLDADLPPPNADSPLTVSRPPSPWMQTPSPCRQTPFIWMQTPNRQPPMDADPPMVTWPEITTGKPTPWMLVMWPVMHAGKPTPLPLWTDKHLWKHYHWRI